GVPDGDITGAQFTVISGAAAGTSLPVATLSGKTLTIGMGMGLAELPGAYMALKLPNVQPGDKVRIDNSATLAYQSANRHYLPGSQEFYAWNQFRGSDGQPLYPQRSKPSAPNPRNGHINGKVLVMEAMMDIHAWPWQADWYRSAIKKALGAKFEDNFVLWYI